VDNLEYLRQAIEVNSVDHIGPKSTALRVRRDKLLAELNVVDKLIVVSEHATDTSTSVADRIRALLHANPTMAFSPKELMEATHSGEESVRKALTVLVEQGHLLRASRASYQIDPQFELDGWQRARLLRGWED